MKLKYIKEATDEDIEMINKETKHNLYNKYYWHYMGNSYFSGVPKENNGYGRKYMSILNDKKEVVGLIQITRKMPRTIATLGFVVLEKYKGNGFGKRAIIELLKLCKKTGIKNILIDTTNKKLIKYYEQFGFKVVGRFKDRVQLPDFKLYDKIFMQLIIR